MLYLPWSIAHELCKLNLSSSYRLSCIITSRIVILLDFIYMHILFGSNVALWELHIRNDEAKTIISIEKILDLSLQLIVVVTIYLEVVQQFIYGEFGSHLST